MSTTRENVVVGKLVTVEMKNLTFDFYQEKGKVLYDFQAMTMKVRIF